MSIKFGRTSSSLIIILGIYSVCCVAADEVSLFELSLEELSNISVTTVSRVQEGRDHAAGTIHVITQEMIKERGYRSLKDALQVVPGFTVFMNELMFTAGIRGLNGNDNEKITLLINGRESNGVNEPNFLNGPINLDSVERVEIIVGPSSLFQQANTLAATVNVITRKTQGIEAIIASGNDQPYAATLMGGKEWSANRYVSASVSYEQKEGFDAWDQDNRSVLADTTVTGKLEPSVFALFEGRMDNWWGQIVVHESESGADLQLNGSGRRNDSFLKDKMYKLDLEHTYDYSPSITTKTRFGIAYKQQDRLNKNGFPPDGGLEQRISQVDYTAEFGLEYDGINDHFIQAGIQFTVEDNFDSFFTINQTQTTLIDKDTHALGVYFSDTWQYNDKLKLIAGIRADDNTIVDERIYWGGRFAAIYDISDKWISKAMINRAIRMPSPLAALNQVWGTNNPSPPTFANTSPTAQKPEKLTTFEWQNIYYFNKTRASVTLYYQELEDFITWVAPHTNAGDYSGFGLEFDVVHDFNKDLSMWFTGSYIDSEFNSFFNIDSDPTIIGNEHVQVNTDGEIVGAPIITANLGIDYQFNNNINFSGQARYFTSQTAFSLNKASFEELDDRIYLDAALTYEDFIVDGVDLRFSGHNVLNNKSKVATQWSKTQYEPRGATYLITLFSHF
ncbi:MAG: TonB-dependent receptor [Proteobacteria bacterium]|nr:TonB-dependent receptor [Pseudomonadota bacterium]